MIYSILVIWVLYSLLEGKREAIFWHHRIKSSDYNTFKSIDRHPMFMFQRSLTLLSTGMASFYISDNIWLGIYITVLNMLLFSFFHNGAMYLERKNMSREANPTDSTKWIYPKGWWDQSKTSTAKLTKFMSPVSRTIQASIGVVGYIVYLFL